MNFFEAHSPADASHDGQFIISPPLVLDSSERISEL